MSMEQRIITINMRKAIEAVPRYKRAAAASKFVSAFVKRHMKADIVSMDIGVNNEIFKNGMKNPPVRIRVSCSKDDNKKVTVSLIKSSVEPKKDGTK